MTDQETLSQAEVICQSLREEDDGVRREVLAHAGSRWALGSLENSVTLTTPDDIGTLTAQIVFFEPRMRNQIVYLAGDTVTYGQVASMLERVLDRPFKRNVWTVDYLMQALEKDPTHHIKKYRAVFAQGKGVAWPKAATFNEQQSIPVTTAEQWARENLAVH